MSWAKLDDGFHSHPRTVQAGLEANGLFCRAISYCAHFRTDGFVPAEWMETQESPAAAKRAIKRLINAGLIERIEGGYVLNGYLERHLSRSQIEEKMRKDAARKAGNPNGFHAESARNGNGT